MQYACIHALFTSLVESSVSARHLLKKTTKNQNMCSLFLLSKSAALKQQCRSDQTRYFEIILQKVALNFDLWRLMKVFGTFLSCQRGPR